MYNRCQLKPTLLLSLSLTHSATLPLMEAHSFLQLPPCFCSAHPGYVQILLFFFMTFLRSACLSFFQTTEAFIITCPNYCNHLLSSLTDIHKKPISSRRRWLTQSSSAVTLTTITPLLITPESSFSFLSSTSRPPTALHLPIYLLLSLPPPAAHKPLLLQQQCQPYPPICQLFANRYIHDFFNIAVVCVMLSYN